MGDEFRWTRELTCELIWNYEMHPILYSGCNDGYVNRIKKTDAYKSILNALKPLDENITVGAIKRKIHTLRTQFAKEFRIMEESKKSGAAAEDLYEPKLWCYEQLGFLKTFCKPRSSESNKEEKKQNQVAIPVQDTSSQDDFDSEFDVIRKRKKSASSTSNAAKRLARLEAIFEQKLCNKSCYSWLGKQVVFQIDSIQNENIKQKAIGEIQEILRKSIEEDLALRRLSQTGPVKSEEPVASTSTVPILSVDEIKSSLSPLDEARSPFAPDLLEQSMGRVFDEKEII